MAISFSQPDGGRAEFRRRFIAKRIIEELDRLEEAVLLNMYCEPESVDMVVGPEGGIHHGVLFKLEHAEKMVDRIFRGDPILGREYLSGPTLPFQIGIATVVGQLHDAYLESRY